MKVLMSLLVLISMSSVFSQDNPPEVRHECFYYPETDAQFPGGVATMQEFFVKNLHYPEEAMEYGDQGNVYVEFVVEIDGEITNIQIAKSVSRELDKEAKRLIQLMPNWVPGERSGEKIRTRVRLPVKFVMY